MSEHSSNFMAKAEIKAADREHRNKINFNISKYDAVVPVGKQQFTDVHLAREKAKNVKWKAIETLDKQLETVKRGRFQQCSQQIHGVFDEYRKWVNDTLTTEPQPWIQVLAAVSHLQVAGS